MSAEPARPKGASLEDEFQKKALASGRVMVNQLAILVKVAQMHDLKNEAVVNSAQALLGTISPFFEDKKSVSLNLIGEYLFIEDVRIKYNVEDFANFDFLAGAFRKRKLGSLIFNPLVDADQLILFVNIFLAAQTDTDDAHHDLALRIGASGVSGISTEELKAPRAEDESERIIDAARAAARAYVRVVLRVKELFEAIALGEPADIRKLKRAVQSLIDSVYKSEDVLLKLSAIRRQEDLFPRHFVNVCVLSLLIGKQTGLSKYHMARLGMAALLHDIGLENRPREPGEEAFESLADHPRAGVQTILKLKGLNEAAVSAMIVAYEHHRNVDGTGYPKAVETKDLSVYSRIVRIADNYDAVTSSGIFGSEAIPPERALRLMSGRAGSYYDRELLDKFVSAMGLYPVGSFVMLSDGRPAVVVSPGKGKDRPSRPLVAALVDEGGAEFLDLSGKDGGCKLSIAGTLDPQRYGVNVSRYLFLD